MRTFKTLDEYEENYFRTHPEEIDKYLDIIFEEYAKDRDLGALLASLRAVSRAQGITATAESAGLSRKGLQKALSKEGNPKFESVINILGALGYKLVPEKLKHS